MYVIASNGMMYLSAMLPLLPELNARVMHLGMYVGLSVSKNYCTD